MDKIIINRNLFLALKNVLKNVLNEKCSRRVRIKKMCETKSNLAGRFCYDFYEQEDYN